MKKKNVLFSAVLAATGLILISATGIYYNTNHITDVNDGELTPQELTNGAFDYYNSQRINLSTGKINPADVINARNQANAIGGTFKTAATLNWSELGPDNFGGRVRTILIDKKDNTGNTIYAGGVAGGLWRSTNAGLSWSLVVSNDNSKVDNSCITALAQAPDGTIYIGTGEGWGNDVGFAGAGMWKYSNSSFTRLTNTIPAVNAASGDWLFVNKIIVSPSNSSKVWAATNSGLKISTDAGSTWADVLSNSDMGGKADDVEVGSDGTVIASVNKKCYLSSNGDAGSFTQITAGLPAVTTTVRMELAIAPSNPDYMYAMIADSVSATDYGKLKGFYQSTNKGQNWNLIIPGGSQSFAPFGVPTGSTPQTISPQLGWYCNTLEVYPNNHKKVLLGGVDLYIWNDGGIPSLIDYSIYFPQNTVYVHKNKHAIAFAGNNSFFVATDGGVFRTQNANSSIINFTPVNKGLNITQFNSIAFQSLPSASSVVGGTVGNGTLLIDVTTPTQKSAEDIGLTINGGQTQVSLLNRDAIFSTGSYGTIYRNATKGSTPSSFYSGRMTTAFSGTLGKPAFAALVTPTDLWESYLDENSKDTVMFVNSPVKSAIIENGNGTKKNFAGTLNQTQKSARIVPGTVKFIAGTQTVTDNGSGGLTGSGSGTIDYDSHVYNFTFNSAPGNGITLVVSFNVEFQSGKVVMVNSAIPNNQFPYTTPSQINPNDTLLLIDKIQTRLGIGFKDNNGVWITRMNLDFKNKMVWVKVAGTNSKPDAFTGETRNLKFTGDGDVLYVGSYDKIAKKSYVYRISNLGNVKDSITGDVDSKTGANANCIVSCKKIAVFTDRTITGIATDRNNNNRLVVTLGNYGNSNYVYYCDSAATITTTATDETKFKAVQGGLPAMPVYCAMFEKSNSNMVLIGTEYGVYSTDDITAGSVTWNDQNNNFPKVPVSEIRQQKLPYWNVDNSGFIYASTQGRGAWICKDMATLSGISKNAPASNSAFNNGLIVYPNPSNEVSYLKFDLGTTSSVALRIYDLQGKLMLDKNMGVLQAGPQAIGLETSILPEGTYLVSLKGEGVNASTRFVVTH